MTKLTSLLATALLLALAAPWANALEMGELVARSRLGQPFVGEIPLRGELYSQLGADCFRLVKPIDDAGLPDLQGVRFSYLTDARGAVLRLAGSEKVLEPALQVSVFIGCGMNLQRDYVLFMDLPGTPTRVAEAATPSVVIAPPTTKPRTQVSSPARKTAESTAPKPTSQVKPVPAAKPAAEIAAPVEKPAPPAAAIVPPPPAPATAPEANAPAPTPKETTPVPAAQPTEAASPSDPWITAGLILLISLLLLGIWLQHRRNIREAALEEGYPHGEHPAAQDAFRGFAASKAADQATPTPAAPPKPASAARLAPDDEMPIVPANMKGEYMMDLTDVMLSFGETQRALSALNEFVHEHPDEAVAPWLRLLDLLRVHGKREEFDSLALKLHQVFNIEIPQWELGQPVTEPIAPKTAVPEATLEDFIHVRQRLQDIWGREECMKYLDILMRDNRAGQRKGFPVEVVEELILLRDVLSVRLNKA
jgi:hypothetical protein